MDQATSEGEQQEGKGRVMTDERAIIVGRAIKGPLHAVWTIRIRAKDGAATNHRTDEYALCGARLHDSSPFMSAKLVFLKGGEKVCSRCADKLLPLICDGVEAET